MIKYEFNNIDEEIERLKARLKRKQEEKESIIHLIKKYITDDNKDSRLTIYLNAGLSYLLQEPPVGIISFSNSIDSNTFGFNDCTKYLNIDNEKNKHIFVHWAKGLMHTLPIYAFELENIKYIINVKDYWKYQVDKNKTEYSYQDYVNLELIKKTKNEWFDILKEHSEKYETFNIFKLTVPELEITDLVYIQLNKHTNNLFETTE